MPPLGHHLRPRAIGLYKELHRLGVSCDKGEETLGTLARGGRVVGRHCRPALVLAIARIPSVTGAHYPSCIIGSATIPIPSTTLSASCGKCEWTQSVSALAQRPLLSVFVPHRFRKNASLTDDKEIQQKLALGDFVRKGFYSQWQTAALVQKRRLLTAMTTIDRNRDALLAEKVQDLAKKVSLA
jgi:hypothetical protein